MAETGHASPPSALVLAIKGRCPRCGSAPLFDGLLRFQPRCSHCGLDFSAFNVGDGAVPFLILLIGALTTGLALWLELSQSPPWWVHVMLWLPLVTGLTIGLLRIAKALLLALEYRHKAGEGQQ